MNLLLFSLWNFHLIAESLPVSSSGHMRLISLLYERCMPQERNLPSYSTISLTPQQEHLMHLPTLGILLWFLSTYIPLWTGLPWSEVLVSWALPLCITNGITGALYLLTKRRTLEKFPLYLGFFITGCTLLVVSSLSFGTFSAVSVGPAILLGIAQACTLLPGISRLAFTYTAGCMLSLAPEVSMLFSLSSECILIVCAVAKALIDLNKTHTFTELTNLLYSLSWKRSLILLATCYISYQALVYVTSLCITQKTFPFAVYMLILALLVLYIEKINPPIAYCPKDLI